MTLYNAILLRTQFPRHTGDGGSLAHRGVDSLQPFKVTAKD